VWGCTRTSPPYGEAQIQAAYVDGAVSAALSATLQLLSLIPFVIFLAALWRRLRENDDVLAMITLIGGFSTIIVILIWMAAIVGVLVLANRVDPGSDVRPLLAFSSALDQSVTLPLAIMTGAAGAAILVGRAFPRWLGWLAILVAVLGIVGAVAILVHFTSEELGPIVAAANPIAYLLFLVWVTGVSVALVRSPERGT